MRDLGAQNEVDYAMRDLIAMGRMVGPRMFVAGQGLSAGRGGPVDPEAFRQQAEARIAAASDWIKIFGSRGSYQSGDTTQTAPFESMKGWSTRRTRRTTKWRFTLTVRPASGTRCVPAPIRSSTAPTSTWRSTKYDG